jgi:glycosyltransferase involved in cell wall biosynthesis
MRAIAVILLQLLYTTSVIGLALYGIQALWLTACTLRRYRTTAKATLRTTGGNPAAIRDPEAQPYPVAYIPEEAAPPITWPVVTVQLPIYNERHVIERLIDACAMLDYPRAKLQIQVLDDSDDQTTALAAGAVESWQQRGIDITLVRRADRTGFKAGALAYGLTQAVGEFIAIFDADFVPSPDFLRQTLPHFFASTAPVSAPHTNATATIGFVQTRWGHLNATYSALTRCQALALDGHFVVEQGGRQWAGLAMGFNGSGGLWRRSCIEDPRVGGWHIDTLCEDLDLSYRAQLVGWQPHYRNEIEAPAEVPPQLISFKRQQFRWAKGSIQTLRKLGLRVWQSDWPIHKRLAALIHLGGYLIHPLLLLLLLTSLPLLLLGADPGAHIALLSAASLGPPLLYAVGQVVLYRGRWWHRWSYLPLLTLLGTGLCFSNTVAVCQGLTNHSGPFLRTPKFRLEQSSDGWQRSSYRLPIDSSFFGELVLFLYAAITVGVAFNGGDWMFGSYLLLYVGGFALMLGMSLWQARPILKHQSASAPGPRAQRPLTH